MTLTDAARPGRPTVAWHALTDEVATGRESTARG